MSTLDYLAQPDLNPSCRRLAATEILLFLPDDPTQPVPANVLKRKEGIFNRELKYLALVRSGFDASRRGKFSALYPISIGVYRELSDLLGYEAASANFPVQIDDYCKTLRTLASGEQPTPKQTNDLKRFLKKISLDFDKDKPSQANTESLLNSLSYISH
jgi:hypothetical protein